MSGAEVAKRIHRLRENVPVVLMSGWGAPSEAHRESFAAWIQKPFLVSELVAVIERVSSRD